MSEVVPQKMPLSELVHYVGQDMGVSSWTVLTQERIQEFAHCTGDHQWIHVDVERAARESPFGTTIAHGFLTVSLIAPTAFELLVARVDPTSVVNYGLKKFALLRPRARRQASPQPHQADRRRPTRCRPYRVTTENTIEIEGEIKPALIATSIAIFIQ